jgi:cobalt-zinc-cadmium resistance protein CzcA
MVHKLIQLSLNNPLVVIFLVLVLIVGGAFSFLHINVEAYPDPAPPIIEVVAQYPGASAQEVERQVTIPLEVTLAGMPGLQITRSKSLFGLSHLRNQFRYDISYKDARQEVINRLQFATNLPPGVSAQVSPATPIGEIYRYTLTSPKNALGQDVYTLNDLKAIQDWLLEREFKRVDRIIDVSGVGGTVKRYEVHPDPERLRRFGITLQQLQNTIANSNANVGGDYLKQGHIVEVVRNVGVIGSGKDPMERAMAMKTPEEAAAFLRAEDLRRIHEIRQLVITTVNNVPIFVNDVVQGGPVPLKFARPGKAAAKGDQGEAPAIPPRRFKYDWQKDYYQDYDLDRLGREGVVVGHQTRLGQVSMATPRDPEGKTWLFEPEKVMGIVLLHKDKDSLPAINDAKKKAEELNEPGRLLPGVQLEPYYDRSDLINITTETVRHNLILGIILVSVILLMFLHNVRSALIVAINVPLSLLFAFTVLYVRGRSANLLSIGAVDFGIIVDSSVIMVENIYRHLCAGENAELPLKERILRACREVEHSLLFSTLIMVCAFLPLFTMQGPEGQIFGPMAETYAFALGGALLLALTIAPVLCLFFFRNLKPVPDNFLVRYLKRSYLRQLRICLNHRVLTLIVFGSLIIGTLVFLLPHLGREFMPQLEEGNLWLRGNFPPNSSLEEVVRKTSRAEKILARFPEIKLVLSQVGRPDDGTDPTGFNMVQIFIDLKDKRDWPVPEGQSRRRTKDQLIEAIEKDLKNELIGVDWNSSQYIRDNVMEALSGVQGDNSVKIFGPELGKLEELAEKVKDRLESVRGIEDRTGIYRIMGQTNLEFRVDRDKCKRWGVSVSDVNNVITSAVRGQAFTQMVEGEKFFDITLRWPENRRQDLSAILDIPVDITNNQLTQGPAPAMPATPFSGPSTGPVTTGLGTLLPAFFGSQFNTAFTGPLPRVPLRELLTPLGANDLPDPKAEFVRPGVAIIYRENGKRFIPIKFSVQGRDLGSAVAEAQEKTADLFPAPYRAEWGGEFEEMQAAELRLMIIVPLALGLIFLLLYMAFHSFLDAVVILSNVLALSLGGIWALLITGENFSISAAVGFISLFGVAIMDGLLLISYFNQLRLEGLPLQEAIMQGAEKRVRPIMMTALTAVFGLLPAAVSTQIGAQTQRPLAIVVVGGMLTTLFLTRYLMPVLYTFYGDRKRPLPQEEWVVPGPPAGINEPLPDVSPGEITSLLEYLHVCGGEEEIVRIADRTNHKFAEVILTVRAAEMLGLLTSPPQMASLTPGGKRFVEATPDERKALWRERLLTLPLFREVYQLLQREPDHAVDSDFVQESIVMRMPYENYEQVFHTFVRWARFGQLFSYDAETQRIKLSS